jgi:4-hydroxymandelate oxidase
VTDARDPDETTGRLARIVTLADFEPLARAVMEPSGFDYVAGGSWDEVSLHENIAAWRRRRFRPRVLVDVSGVDPTSTFLGQPSALPVAVAPMAFQSLAHADGEIEAARGAAAAGIPYTLSTTSSKPIEAVAAGAPGGTLWFQLYAQADPGVTRSLVERAETAGYRAIILTVDLPVLGYRDRDRRAGFLLPHMGNFVDVPASHGRASPEVSPLLHAPGMEPTLVWGDLAMIRSWTSLPLVLKGILTAEDARIAVEHGVDAIVVSNHGARQLDRVPATVDVLAEVVAVVSGRAEVWVDGGIRRGLDIAIARALGAQGVLVGRPIYWALAAGGAAGVERAIAILREEFALALVLLGTRTPADIGPSHLVG